MAYWTICRKALPGKAIAFIAVCALVSSVNGQAVSDSDLQETVREAAKYLLLVEGVSSGSGPGNWGHADSSLYTTAIVVSALRLAEESRYLHDESQLRSQINSAIHRAYERFGSDIPVAVERQALVAAIRAHARRGTGSYRDLILNQQQADGGWGVSIEHRSSVRDTTMIVDSLIRDQLISVPPERLIAVIDFLDSRLSEQDGGGFAWEHGIGGSSTLMATARGLLAMRSLGAALGSESAVFDPIDVSLDYLVASADPSLVSWPDGTAQGDPAAPDTSTLAMVLRAYAGLRQPGELEGMIDGLFDAKHIYDPNDDGVPDGEYWSETGAASAQGDPTADEVHATASVVLALLSLPELSVDSDLPDLEISSISLGPPLVDSSNPSAVANANALLASFGINLNQTVVDSESTTDGVPEVRVQFFEGDPRRTTVVDGEIVRAEPVGGIMTLGLPFPDVSSFDAVQALGISEIPVQNRDIQQEIMGAVIDFDSRIPEADETNNVHAFAVDGSVLAGTPNADIAIVAHSMSVSHTDLLEEPVVELSVSLWNAGDMDVEVGSSYRIWFRAATYDQSYADYNDGVSDPDFGNDHTLIDYLDIELTEDLGSLEEVGPFSVEWIPSISPSQSVTVYVESLQSGAPYYDSDISNNADEESFAFETGQLNMSHVRAANGDLIFFLEYGNYCYSAYHEFAAYSRENTGDPWGLMGNASTGPGGTVSPCSFIIPRAQAWGMTAGTYQALGEVWFGGVNGSAPAYIDDAILQYTIPAFTDITAFSASFMDDMEQPISPQDLVDMAEIHELERLELLLYYQSNLGEAPSIPLDYEIVEVVEDRDEPFIQPIEGQMILPTVTSEPGVLRYLIDLPDDGGGSDPGDQVLFSAKTYAVVVRYESQAAGALRQERRYVFNIANTSGYVLMPKVLNFEGTDVTIPVEAQDGDTITVKIPIRNLGS